MVRKGVAGYSDEWLLARLKNVRELELEVMDPDRHYDRSEWNGLSRQETILDLAREGDALIDECKRRRLVWADAFWPSRQEEEKP